MPIQPVRPLHDRPLTQEEWEHYQEARRIHRKVYDMENMLSVGCYEGKCEDCDDDGCICKCHSKEQPAQ